MTELHRQVRLALNGLLIPPLQDIVIEYIPIVKIEFFQHWLDVTIQSYKSVTFIGTANRQPHNDWCRDFPWGPPFIQWTTGKQIIRIKECELSKFYGDPKNREFVSTIDFSGIVADPNKSHTIEIDPDLNKILRIIEHDGIAPPS
jgi:hypothetical protein